MWELNLHVDPHLTSSPFFSSGEMWFSSRKYLTSASSSMRFKILFSCIEQNCKKFENFVEQGLMKNNGVMEYELKNLFYKYINEVGRSATFSVDGCYFVNKSHPSSFAAISKAIIGTSFHDMISEALNFHFQDLNKIFRISFISKDTDRFFRHSMQKVMSMRQYGDDHLLTFFVNVYETTCVTMSFFRIFDCPASIDTAEVSQ
ncbi:PREDICTED: probable cytochrome P450 28d1 [Dinoponera quadriceps]|uniref:Probable cytochrome P450 28d1 n=1 Tax=Dinoponera quadriceps TaxID=609295 RepID=A0A6P3Y9W0_DINQU|nr:PREDICTED: probable cytochrome P450 28d1 [Dinoponera quadriceps]